jgi:membrane-associated phospholipid phosphatase
VAISRQPEADVAAGVASAHIMPVKIAAFPLALPVGSERWRLAALSIAFGVFFYSVYWLANHYTGTLTSRHRVDFAFEASIPFLPWMILLYLSITPLLILLPFRFRTTVDALPAFATLCSQVAIAGLVFVVFPAELGFPEPIVSGPVAIPFAAATAINLTYNLLPSLHVAFALSAAVFLADAGSTAWRTGIWLWSLLIVASTVLTHQHHLADVAAGAILSALTLRFPYRSVVGRNSAKDPR